MIKIALFIKGITYFEDQLDKNNPEPVYHCIWSCGPGNDTFRQ